MRRRVMVHDRADVVYTLRDGRLVAWIVLADGNLHEVSAAETMATLDGDKARAAIAQNLER